MQRRRKRAGFAIAASGLVALALSGCSGASGYDFSEPATEPAADVQVSLPHDVLESETEAGNVQLIGSYSVEWIGTTASHCAARVNIEYAGGGVERLLELHSMQGTSMNDTTMIVAAITGSHTWSMFPTRYFSEDSDRGIYYSEDMSELIVVSGCSESAGDRSFTLRFIQDASSGDGTGLHGVASVDIALLRNGTVAVASGVLGPD